MLLENKWIIACPHPPLPSHIFFLHGYAIFSSYMHVPLPPSHPICMCHTHPTFSIYSLLLHARATSNFLHPFSPPTCTCHTQPCPSIHSSYIHIPHPTLSIHSLLLHACATPNLVHPFSPPTCMCHTYHHSQALCMHMPPQPCPAIITDTFLKIIRASHQVVIQIQR